MFDVTRPDGAQRAEILHRALQLACQRVAESSHVYDEAHTPEQWYTEFVQRAQVFEDQRSADTLAMFPEQRY